MQMSQGGLERPERCRGKASNCDYKKSSDRNRWPDAIEETAYIQSRYLGSLRANFLHLSLNDLSSEKKGGFRGGEWAVLGDAATGEKDRQAMPSLSLDVAYKRTSK